MEENIYLFVEALKSCPWYNKIFEQYPVVMLYITGSRLYGITDERSDYDLVAICDCNNIKRTEPDMFFTWKGKKVHWSWLPIGLYKTQENATKLQNVGLSEFCKIEEKFIVYKNETYEKEIYSLIENKKTIAYNGTKNLFSQLNEYINEICECGYIDENHRSKFLCHLCRAYYDLTDTPYDFEFLRNIKRIRWQTVSEEYRSKAVECIKALKDLLDKK